MHVKYAAIFPHNEQEQTKFLSLDKCLPGRDFLQVLDFGEKDDIENEIELYYDEEWLII